MLQVTPAAVAKIKEELASHRKENWFVRLYMAFG